MTETDECFGFWDDVSPSNVTTEQLQPTTVGSREGLLPYLTYSLTFILFNCTLNPITSQPIKTLYSTLDCISLYAFVQQPVSKIYVTETQYIYYTQSFHSIVK